VASDDDHVQSGRLRRFSRLAWLTARTTGDLLAGKARTKLGGEASPEADSATLNAAAERILSTLGDLKGAALKLGQALAMDPDALPPEARKIVAKLLSQAPSRMPFEMVSSVVKAELGKPHDQLFARFDPEPLAAASLGQVHAAKLLDADGGAEVVVKVQYPGVDKALESDISNAGVLVKGIAMSGETLDGRPYYEEIRESLLRELDYLEEAKQNAAFAVAASGFPELVVPKVIPHLSTHRVLTLERLSGPNLMDVIESDADEAERYRVGRLLILAIWGPFYAGRLIHADPHPGNFLVLPDGRLGVLDFGATKLLSPRFGNVYRKLLERNAQGKTRQDVAKILSEAGFRFIGDADDAYDLCDEIADIVERPITTEHYDFGADPMVADTRRLVQSKPGVLLQIKPPAEAVQFYRAAAGLAQDLRLLKMRGNFRSILAEIVARGIRPEQA
jgi:predicted unusual protein kinase regulating ubiquinone biosynthesis (AarF/ABC1/UbiB family)